MTCAPIPAFGSRKARTPASGRAYTRARDAEMLAAESAAGARAETASRRAPSAILARFMGNLRISPTLPHPGGRAA
jgi:hypothetical protein